MTDASGAASFDFLPANPVTCEVRAPGLLTQLLVVEGPKAPGKPVRVRLRNDADPPGTDIPWRLSIPAALAESKKTGRAVFLVMTMDGEKANDWMAGHHYHDREVVRAAREVVPIISSAFGKGGVGENDHDEKDGKCTRYGVIPCQVHQEIEKRRPRGPDGDPHGVRGAAALRADAGGRTPVRARVLPERARPRAPARARASTHRSRRRRAPRSRAAGRPSWRTSRTPTSPCARRVRARSRCSRARATSTPPRWCRGWRRSASRPRCGATSSARCTRAACASPRPDVRRSLARSRPRRAPRAVQPHRRGRLRRGLARPARVRDPDQRRPGARRVAPRARCRGEGGRGHGPRFRRREPLAARRGADRGSGDRPRPGAGRRPRARRPVRAPPPAPRARPPGGRGSSARRRS